MKKTEGRKSRDTVPYEKNTNGIFFKTVDSNILLINLNEYNKRSRHTRKGERIFLLEV
jgi:hypothetical protein